jgi:hypothetical protein
MEVSEKFWENLKTNVDATIMLKDKTPLFAFSGGSKQAIHGVQGYIERRDLLVPQDIREARSFFLHHVFGWELSQKS